jgi:coenzyme F420-0:L-glutamate ligase/coenzyme F420-1:gamma-L-glutamate ligase
VNEIRVHAPDGVPEVSAGDDVVELLLAVADLADGDVVAVTSKVVSKAEGRVRAGTREEALAGQTQRVVARRGATTIVRTHHGLTLAAAGIDASNVASGHVVLLPTDPDASARALRHGIRERTRANVGVVVTDTAGRAWRAGQTDIAIGAAGLRVLEEYVGRVDAHGNELAVTAPAVADEIAGAAELAQGKLGARPFAVVRGRPDLVLPPGDDGPGAAAIVRPDGADMFGLGAREAVLAALRGDPAGITAFGGPAAADDLVAALQSLSGVTAPRRDGETVRCEPEDAARQAAVAVAFAHGWVTVRADDAAEVRFRPVTP